MGHAMPQTETAHRAVQQDGKATSAIGVINVYLKISFYDRNVFKIIRALGNFDFYQTDTIQMSTVIIFYSTC